MRLWVFLLWAFHLGRGDGNNRFLLCLLYNTLKSLKHSLHSLWQQINTVVICQDSWYAHLFNKHCLLCSLHQQILLREGCKKILVADSLSLLKKMHRTQMKGVLVDGGYRGNMMTFNILRLLLGLYTPWLSALEAAQKPEVFYLICRV